MSVDAPERVVPAVLGAWAGTGLPAYRVSTGLVWLTADRAGVGALEEQYVSHARIVGPTTEPVKMIGDRAASRLAYPAPFSTPGACPGGASPSRRTVVSATG
jgi:hypothetical protein